MFANLTSRTQRHLWHCGFDFGWFQVNQFHMEHLASVCRDSLFGQGSRPVWEWHVFDCCSVQHQGCKVCGAFLQMVMFARSIGAAAFPPSSLSGSSSSEALPAMCQPYVPHTKQSEGGVSAESELVFGFFSWTTSVFWWRSLNGKMWNTQKSVMKAVRLWRGSGREVVWAESGRLGAGRQEAVGEEKDRKKRPSSSSFVIIRGVIQGGAA